MKPDVYEKELLLKRDKKAETKDKQKQEQIGVRISASGTQA